jgi:hypothetical protein
MAARFAPVLLAHLFHPDHNDIQIYTSDQTRPLRQIWLPNASHVDMLHHMAYAYTFARKGDPERISLLNALGRAAGWLFREFNRPGQMTVMAASEALKESFTFPSEDIRQGHLGYLLAWLETQGGRENRLAAAAKAEEQSISTTLNPAIERDTLDDLVETYRVADREGKTTTAKRVATEIEVLLEAELLRRFELTVRAIKYLRKDDRPDNAGIDELLKDGFASHWFEYMRTERSLSDDPSAKVFIPSPETDRQPTYAAENYFRQQESEDRREMLLLEDDLEMQAEACAVGDAIHGKINRVWDEGTGKRTVPVWEVVSDGELATKIRKNQQMFVAGLRKRKGRVRGVALRAGKTVFEVEITSLTTVPNSNPGGRIPRASSPLLKGATVTLLAGALEGIQRLKRSKLREPAAPGAWLTDSKPAGKRTRIPPDVAGPADGPPAGSGGAT